jgi:hypothetical protein
MKMEKITLKVIMQMHVSKGFLLEQASHPKVTMPTNNSIVTSDSGNKKEPSTILKCS